MKSKKTANRQYLNCYIAGFSHWEGCLVLGELKVGTKLELERELNNPYDPQAVAIYYGDTKLGYIPASSNEEIGKFLELGHTDLFEARVQAVSPEATHPEKQVRVVVFIKGKNSDKE